MSAAFRLAFLVLLVLLPPAAAGCSTLGLPDTPSDEIWLDSAKPERHHRRGVRLAKDGKFEKAEAAFHTALRLDESFGPAHNNLGLLFYQKGDLYSAAWAFEQAIRLLPDRPEPINNMGLTLEAAGRYDDAIELYRTAWTLEPANPEYLGNLVRARLRRGDTDSGLRHELGELLLVETRPPWRAFAQEQLTLLSRVTAGRLESTERSGQGPLPEVLPDPTGDAWPSPPGAMPLPGDGATFRFSDLE